jgi:mannosyltransferase
MKTNRNTQVHHWVEYILLLLITLLAAVLRFYKLGEWSYFLDELYTWRDSLQAYASPLTMVLYPDERQAFWLSTKLSMDIFGENAVALRFFPCIFGTLTVPLLYFPFKTLFDKRVAFLAIFMLTISPWHIYYSQMARWYSILLLLIFFCLVSFYFFIEYGRTKYFLAYLLLLYIALSFHLTAGFVVGIVLSYSIFLLIFPKFQSGNVQTRKLLIVLAIHFGLILASIPRLINFITKWNATEELFGSWGSDLLIKFIYHVTPSIAFVAFVAFIVSLKITDRKGVFFATYCLIPLVVLSIASMFNFNVNPRYLLFVLPGILLLVSCLCVYLKDQLSSNSTILAIAFIFSLVLPSLQSTYLYFTSAYGYRDRLREAVQFIKNQKLDNDQFFPLSLYSTSFQNDFYFKTVTYLEGLNITDEELILSSSTDGIDLKRRTWILTGSQLSRKDESHKWISENAHLLAEFRVVRGDQDHGIKVFLYAP